jgi:hypothetical protein
MGFMGEHNNPSFAEFFFRNVIIIEKSRAKSRANFRIL